MTETIENSRNEELILYIIEKLNASKSFGSIILNKILYYVDNIHYLRYGKPLSGFKYIRQNLGPTPQPATFLPLRRKLIKEGKVKEEILDGIIRTKKKLVAVSPFKKCYLEEIELKLIDEVISDFESKTAPEISDLSHNELGWQLTKNGEEIPFHAFLLTVPNLAEEDYIWAQDELTKLGCL